MSFGYMLTLIISFACFLLIYASSPTVKTKFGELRGLLSRPFDSNGNKEQAEIYLNIPYALPPLENRRFEKPHAYNLKWSKARDAKEFGPGCVPVINDLNLPVSEDCLTLNVFRPHKKKSKDELLPVLVYVHGGGFAFGLSMIYGYQDFAQNYVSQDLVVVTINYRLGFFGFASLGSNKNFDSNLGLFDQAMAFQWIHDNIKNFGGDPSRVTAQGLSAGAASVGLLALSPHSRDNLQQIVEMSGSSNAVWAVSDESIDYTQKFAQQINCPFDDGQKFKECLKKKSTDELLDETTKFTKPTPKFLQFTPVIDGDFFPKPLNELILEAPKIPTLTGVTALESQYFVVLCKDMPINSVAVPSDQQIKYGREDLVNYVKNFTHWFGHIFENKKQLAQHEILKFYLRDEEKNRKEEYYYLKKFNELTSDFFFAIPSLKLAQTRSSLGWPTYFYLNSYYNPQQFTEKTPCQAATHAQEYPYMNGLYPIGEFEFNDKDEKFRQLLSDILVEFVKNGHPNKDWPHLTKSFLAYGHLTKEATLELYRHDKESLIKETFNFWSKLGSHLSDDVVHGLPKVEETHKIEL